MCPSFTTYCNFSVYEVESYFKCSLFEGKEHLKYQSTNLFPPVKNCVSCSRNRSQLRPRRLTSPTFAPLHPPPSLTTKGNSPALHHRLVLPILELWNHTVCTFFLPIFFAQPLWVKGYSFSKENLVGPYQNEIPGKRKAVFSRNERIVRSQRIYKF